MNLAIHGLEGDIRHGGHINSYYDDPHEAVGKFDFVLANPPFNVNAVDKDRLAADVGAGRRIPFGLPRTDNANYLWIQLFYSSLNAQGRAGFVMANSASDARSSEQELRRQLIEARAVDVMVAVGPNMFYTVTLPCTLWFLDKGKAAHSSPDKGRPGGVSRRDTILFIDARHIFRQIDRAHRDWSEAQISFIANIVRLYRGEEPDYTLGGETAAEKLLELFSPSPSIRPERSKAESKGNGAQDRLRVAKSKGSNAKALQVAEAPASYRVLCYRDISGLCKAASLKEIETQGWSLNAGRYVDVAPGEEVSDEDFKEKLEALNEELEVLNAQARELEATIAANVAEILEA
jgi:type I restriction enzyme M protein